MFGDRTSHAVGGPLGAIPFNPQAPVEPSRLTRGMTSGPIPSPHARASNARTTLYRGNSMSAQQRRTSILQLRHASMSAKPNAQSTLPDGQLQDFGEMLNSEFAKIKECIHQSGERLMYAHQALGAPRKSGLFSAPKDFARQGSSGEATGSLEVARCLSGTRHSARPAMETGSIKEDRSEIIELTKEERHLGEEMARLKASSSEPLFAPRSCSVAPNNGEPVLELNVVPEAYESGTESVGTVATVGTTAVVDLVRQHTSEERRSSKNSAVSKTSAQTVMTVVATNRAQSVEDAQDLSDELSEPEVADDGGDLFRLLNIWELRLASNNAHAPSNKLSQLSNQRRVSTIQKLTFKFRDLLLNDNCDLETDDGRGGGEAKYKGFHPGNPLRGSWDMLSILFVFYDMVVIPFMLFEPPLQVWMTVMIWATRIFWTVDIPFSFLTGFIQADGSLETRLPIIARRYLCNWFVLDITLVCVDWFEALLGGRDHRITPRGFFRILRLIRLLRMIRMGHLISLILERFHSERLSVFSDIFKIVIVVVAIAHLIACVWYGIGRPGKLSRTWINEHVPNSMDLGHRYAVSLHWALSQFTGGMDEIRPANAAERFFAIIIFIFTFILAAIIVSSLTSSMTRLHFIASYQSKQFFQLRRYLIQNSISEELTLRIQRNAQHAILERQHFMEESNVDLLGFVSEPLRIDLHFELYSPVLEVHPFFMRYIQECPQVMRKVCHRAMAMTVVTTGDTIFDIGEIRSDPKMYFLCSGTMQYVSISGTVSEVEAIQWIAEASLWTHWMHIGVLTATSECRLVVLDSTKFQDIVDQFSHQGFDPSEYAKKFVMELNATDEEVTDLPLSIHQKSKVAKKQMTRRMAMAMK